MRILLGGIPLVVVALVLTGCASISVQPGQNVATDQPPKKVYVEGFDTSTGDFRVDREGEELVAFKSSLQIMMSAGISYDLTKRLIPAERIDGHPRFPRQAAWVIKGEFVRVEQGSRLLRGTVGFGLGATKLVCRVRVYNLADSRPGPFLSFTTTGGSNAEPGAITSFATDPLTLVIQAAAGSAGNIAHGITEDTERTAREITATLSDYMYHHGWIPKDKWVKPKIYGD
ncbi:MAG TPA: DUF4410 domain-containing protein [Candidatus Methylacidiphilales bacterium]|jgi:hypothetical protein|nr:DUF4410 domain-containing protein [Candidatus Methylacidiphilales bacterium]